jgi:hypothetical protein
MPGVQGVKGQAVVVYADPLTTEQVRYHRLSRRVNYHAPPSVAKCIAATEGAASSSLIKL